MSKFQSILLMSTDNITLDSDALIETLNKQIEGLKNKFEVIKSLNSDQAEKEQENTLSKFSEFTQRPPNQKQVKQTESSEIHRLKKLLTEKEKLINEMCLDFESQLEEKSQKIESLSNDIFKLKSKESRNCKSGALPSKQQTPTNLDFMEKIISEKNFYEEQLVNFKLEFAEKSQKLNELEDILEKTARNLGLSNRRNLELTSENKRLKSEIEYLRTNGLCESNSAISSSCIMNSDRFNLDVFCESYHDTLEIQINEEYFPVVGSITDGKPRHEAKSIGKSESPNGKKFLDMKTLIPRKDLKLQEEDVEYSPVFTDPNDYRSYLPTEADSNFNHNFPRQDQEAEEKTQGRAVNASVLGKFKRLFFG